MCKCGVAVHVWRPEVNFGYHCLIFFLKKLFTFICVSVLSAYIFAACACLVPDAWCLMPGAWHLVPVDVRKGTDHMALELQVVMNSYVGAGNQTWVICKSKQPVF